MWEAMDHTIRSQIELNGQKWPLDSKWYYDSNSYLQEVELIREFITLSIQRHDSIFHYE